MIPSTNQELGELDQGLHKAEITLTNTTKRTLEIVKTEVGCRCTEVTVLPKEILPGKSAVLYVTWDTVGVRGVSGNVITIFYRPVGEEDSEKVDVWIFGTIMPEFDIVPDKLEFQEGVAARKILTLTKRTPSCKATILGIQSNFPAFRYEAMSGEQCVVVFEPSEWFVDKLRPEAYIDLQIDSPKEPKFRIPITVHSVVESQ